MQAVSIWNPHALFCVLGMKEYETRGWATGYRGKLLIHASRFDTWGPEERDALDYLAHQYRLKHPLISGLRQSDRSLFSCVLGVVTLTAVYDAAKLAPKISEQERDMGDFREGRYAWRFEDAQLFDKPIKVSGQKNIFDVPDHLIPESVRYPF